MFRKLKKNPKLRKGSIILLVFTILYILFNYLPLKIWIEDEIIYLIVKIIFYAITATIIVILKNKTEIEIETPYHQISFLWLAPLIISVFTNFLFILVADTGELKEIEILALILDIISDIPVSIFEDIIFIDIAIYLLIEILGNQGNGKIISIFVAAILFTLVHSFSLIYEETVSECLIEMMTVFILSIECGYLAVYFNSALIPVGYHLLFNEVNSVIFHSILDMEINSQYLLFYSIILVLNFFYIIALYRISVLQKFRVLYEKYTGKTEDK